MSTHRLASGMQKGRCHDLFMGITGLLEEKRASRWRRLLSANRLDYNLPAAQIDYLRKLKAGNKHPVIALVPGAVQ